MIRRIIGGLRLRCPVHSFTQQCSHYYKFEQNEIRHEFILVFGVGNDHAIKKGKKQQH